MQVDDFLKTIDTTKFCTTPYAKKIEKPWGYELHWVPQDKPYIGKLLHVNAGKRLSLQVHDEKQESWLLMHGEAKVVWADGTGKLIETILQMNMGYTTEVGQKHRLVGITDCDIIEVSTPEKGTTYRLEDDFARPDETPEQRKIERGEK